jgi:hypothetical protein
VCSRLIRSERILRKKSKEEKPNRLDTSVRSLLFCVQIPWQTFLVVSYVILISRCAPSFLGRGLGNLFSVKFKPSFERCYSPHFKL